MSNAGTPNHANHDETTYNTALRGAFLAFQKTPTKPTAGGVSAPALTPNRDVRNGRGDGALLAATSASRDRSLTRSPPSSRQTTGGNSTLGRDQSNFLLAPTKPATGDSRSQSLIAATLAASRSASPNSKTGPSMPTTTANQVAAERRKPNIGENKTVGSAIGPNLTTDLSPIGPTNALISLFEHKEDGDPIKKSPAVSSAKKGPKVELHPMTPPRTISPVSSSDTLPLGPTSFAWEKAASSSSDTGRDMAGTSSLSDARYIKPSSFTSLSLTKKPRSITPPPKTISRANTVLLAPRPRQVSSHKIVTSSSDIDPVSAVPPPRESTTGPQTRASGVTPPVTPSIGEKELGPLVRRSSSSLSNDTFLSASSAPSPQPDSPRRKNQRPLTSEAYRPTRPSSAQAAPVQSPSRAPTLRSLSHLPLDSLTDAIVAGSLASSRATPRATNPPTPPPRKRTPHMRQTLRAPRAKSEDDVTRVKSPHQKKPLGKLSSRKKHAHHEGSRKRWREEITTHERQRYEGLWASNRGLLLDGSSAAANGLRKTDTGQLVVNVVVRDLWARSRLPFDELAEVWDLVDTQGKGVLDRSQFVVGMWLIDQRLRGRKIPRKVSDSVWGSAKGMRVLGPKGKK